MTTTSGPAWWASAFGTIIDGAGAVWVPAGCYDLCTLFKADSDFGIAGWWCKILIGDSCAGGVHVEPARAAAAPLLVASLPAEAPLEHNFRYPRIRELTVDNDAIALGHRARTF